ncbi:hypothetical protein STEG23_004459, partial [Scotinomys teguina]
DLDRNNITRITKMDFAGLKNLRVLHLEDNQVSVIERGAFQDLKQLERLSLCLQGKDFPDRAVSPVHYCTSRKLLDAAAAAAALQFMS